MYYVRLPSGDEKTYRTVEEMVWDVELGVISREALIFHPATKEWVQVTRHPQLGSRFVSDTGAVDEVGLDFDLLSDDEIKGLAPKVPEQPAAPAADLVINDITTDAAEQLAAPAESKPAEGLAIAGDFLTLKEPIPSLVSPAVPAVTAAPSAPSAPSAPRHRSPIPSPSSYLPEPLPLDGELAPLPEEGLASTDYKPLEWTPEPRFRGLALIGGAVLLILLVSTGAWFGWRWWSSRPAAVQAAEPSTRAPGDTALAVQAVDSVSDDDLAQAIALLAVAETAGTGPRAAPRPGRLIPGAQPRVVEGLRPMTPIELRRSYAAAYANARSAMDSDLALGGVSRLFSTARLTSRDSLRAGRRLVTAARNIIRVYHSDEVQVERAYRDTITFQVTRMGWSRSQQADWKARATLKESYEGSQLSDSLLTYTDDLYTLLLGHWGEYELSGNSITFDDPSVADDYQILAGWLQARITQLDSENENASSSPTSRRIARALGGTRPPTLRRSRVPD